MRAIPIAMVPNLKDAAPRWADIWKIMPVAPGVPMLGLTNWDVTIAFDDLSGDGVVQYKAKRGYNTYAMASTADLAVDNSQMEVLIAEYEVDGITADAIRRGSYDDAKFIRYQVNPEDLTAGRYIILGSGSIGRLSNVDGLTGVIETRSLTQILKQKSVIEHGSNSCRVVKFGDERCKLDIGPLWADADVDTVGAESDRVFTVTGAGLTATDAAYWPGLFEFYTGNNAGRSYEVESFDVVAGVMTVTLAIPTETPIQATDTGRIRPDCTRLWSGHNSCETYANRPNYRGEPFRPVSESEQLMAPGGGSPSPVGADSISTDPV